MGATFILFNRTRNQFCYILDQPHKYMEIFNEYSSYFVSWVLLDEWRGDFIEFVSDYNEEKFYDIQNFPDVSKKLLIDFAEFCKDHPEWFVAKKI